MLCEPAHDKTDSNTSMIDLTLDPDALPIAVGQSVIVVASASIQDNADESTPTVWTNKRKHTLGVENLKKKQKFDVALNKANESDSVSLSSESNGNCTNGSDLETTYKCEICSSSFNRKPKLDAHKETHKKVPLYYVHTFQCSICNDKFSAEEQWKSHKNKCKLKRYECYLCKSRSNGEKLMQEHIRQHSGDKPLKCCECEKCFASRLGLNRHKKKIHKK